MHGQFAWYELTTPDTAASLRFYPTFTGWGTQPFDNDYVMFTSGGVPIAGVFRLTDEMRSQGVPPNWMPYIEVANAADSAALAATIGGKVLHGPTSIPKVGDIAVLQDPQGATFGVYKSASGAQSWDGKPVIGKFSWNELMTTDSAKAIEFYRRMFGWSKTGEMDMGGGAMYHMFGKGAAPYGGIFTRTADMASIPPFWLCYIHVKNVPAAVATATRNGARVHRPPMDIPGGVISILGDPQGAGFAVHHESAAPAAARPAAEKPKKKSAKKTKARAKAAPTKSKAKKSKAKKSKAKKSKAKKAKTKSRKRAKPARARKAGRKAKRTKRRARGRRR